MWLAGNMRQPLIVMADNCVSASDEEWHKVQCNVSCHYHEYQPSDHVKTYLANADMSRDPGQADPPTASSDEDLLRQSDDEAASEHSASLSLASSSPPPASDQDLLQENEDDSLRNDSDAASSRSPSKHHDVHCFFMRETTIQ